MTSPTTPAPVPAPVMTPAAAPTRGLTIAGFVLAFLIAPLGAILSIVALVKINRAGGGRGLAIAGIIIGVLGTIGWIVAIVVSTFVVGATVDMVATCLDMGPGVWDVNGTTVTCD